MSKPTTFNHNGGIWTRPDIPSATSQSWKCHVCQKDIDSQVEDYQIQIGNDLVHKERYIPASRYWHGYTVGIEFCSYWCSFLHYEKEIGNPINPADFPDDSSQGLHNP